MVWKLRKATVEDKEKIEQLFIEMLMSIYHTEDVKGYQEGDLDDYLGESEDWICVAEDKGVVVAYLAIEVHRKEDEFIYLDDISVQADHQNQGIGTHLIKTAEQFAKDINMTTVFLHVEKSNEGAFRLYDRLGYKICKEEGSRYEMVKEIV